MTPNHSMIVAFVVFLAAVDHNCIQLVVSCALAISLAVEERPMCNQLGRWLMQFYRWRIVSISGLLLYNGCNGCNDCNLKWWNSLVVFNIFVVLIKSIANMILIIDETIFSLHLASVQCFLREVGNIFLDFNLNDNKLFQLFVNVFDSG